MKTKQEVIQEAYGKAWHKIGKHVLTSGFVESCHYPVKDYHDTEVAYANDGRTYFRPKSLCGIENNNGWIKTEDRLPSNVGKYHTITRRDGFTGTFEITKPISDEIRNYMKIAYSHWKPMEEIKKPLY